MKIIKAATIHEFISPIKPANKYLPLWYKKAPTFLNENKRPEVSELHDNNALKACVPFLDGMTSGYTAELWQDIEVTQTPSGPYIKWGVKPDVLLARSATTTGNMPVPAGHSNAHFAWISPYILKTPPGYSVLVVHPLNRFDLPFTTLSAIVDSDGLFGNGAVPFFLKDNFEGIIKKGTPIFQVIPFKRESWKVQEDDTLIKENEKYRYLSNSVSHGFYKKTYWKRKSYE